MQHCGFGWHHPLPRGGTDLIQVSWTMQMGVDDFEEFSGMKRLGQCADGAEAFRFVKHLLTPVRGDEKNGNLRLQTAQV